jgi:hypothetical protein
MWTVSFTNDFLFSSNAFLARILANEKAETFGSPAREFAVCSFGVSIAVTTLFVSSGSAIEI